MSDKDKSFCTRVIICTLAFLLAGAWGVNLYGLFDTRIDNQQIFGYMTPITSMIIGAFVGYLGGQQKKQDSSNNGTTT